MVECLLPKQKVASSNLVSRSMKLDCCLVAKKNMLDILPGENMSYVILTSSNGMKSIFKIIAN